MTEGSLLAVDVGLRLFSEADALDAIGSGLRGCVFCESDLHPEFFRLANGIAGAAMQKFVNYGFKAAFVVPDDHEHGERVTELMRDHRGHPCIRFFADTATASQWLKDSI